MIKKDIPHLNIVVAACVIAIAGYTVFSIYVVMVLKDATMIGDTIGTWKSFAVLAFGFWIGSSSGGKAEPDTKVQDVNVINPENEPIPTEDKGKTK